MAKRRYRRGRRSRRRGFASWSLGRKLAAIFGGTVTLAALIGVGILASKFTQIEKTELDADALDVTISEEARERGTGYLNVALFGVDSREGKLGKGTLSDCIMIASLNRETLEVRISSVFRDTLVQLDDSSLNKANAAYSFGGPEAAVAMLNRNLDMDIEHYVTVNFNVLIAVIDAIGGVEIDVQPEEVQWVNGYQIETRKVTGVDSPDIAGPGLQTLNGVQATSYSRIRYTAGGDYKRAERQRTVLMKIVEKLQGANLKQLNKLIDELFPQVATNFTMAEIVEYAKDAFDYKLTEMTGFPFDKTTDTLNGIGSTVIPVTLESNVVKLHQFFYGPDVPYTPSSTVSSISGKIVSKAGERKADDDESSAPAMTEEDRESMGGSVSSGTGGGGSSNTGTGGTQSGGSSTGGSTGSETGGGGTGGGGTGGETGGGGAGGDTGSESGGGTGSGDTGGGGADSGGGGEAEDGGGTE